MHSRRFLPSLLFLVLALASVGIAADGKIVLNEQEYFSGPGFSFLLFHNNYEVGYQGGLQMILSEERVLDSGDLLLRAKRDAGDPNLRVVKRVVDREHATATVFGEIEGWSTGYQLICKTDGERILVTLRLDRPLDWTKVEQAGLRMALYPGVYMTKSFQTDSGSGVFPEHFSGKTLLTHATKLLRVAQEDPLHSFSVSRPDGELMLVDTRQDGPESWFMIVAPVAKESPQTEVQVEITPALVPQWRRPPVIEVSQVGYLPTQAKQAFLELDARDRVSEPVNLFEMQLSGEKRLVKSGMPKPWGNFLRYQYAEFDFSDVQQPGVYLLEYAGQTAGPFRIAADVYTQAWQPTLEYFLPVQTCHVAVKEGNRTWHGACHLDDALQAPAHREYIDGYQQGEHETKYADNEHVPGLDWGGWHDAGDFDLPAGSSAITTLALALAQEEFSPHVDMTTIHRAEREVLLNQPDGRQDLLQQIEYGAESLLASYRVAGHIFPGIIEQTDLQYNYVGDPVNITDNRVYDPKLKPLEVQGERSGKLDDRWVFTNRNTGLQYETAQSLAAASRVLRGYRADLADESLATAKNLWEYEENHPPVFAPNSYVPRNDGGFHSQEIAATAELLITTNETKYRDRLLALLPAFKNISGEQFGSGPGWVLVRVLAQVPNPEFKTAVLELAKRWKAAADERAGANPWGVRLPLEVSHPDFKLETRSQVHSFFVWGEGWNLQEDALRQYYLHKTLPDLFGTAPLMATVNYVLGVHPGSNESFVSAVGAHSPLIAYGFNRADWSHIPGGVISGVSLVKPDFMELKEFPFLWYQTEYVIGGAATYIFDVLAVESLMGK